MDGKRKIAFNTEKDIEKSAGREGGMFHSLSVPDKGEDADGKGKEMQQDAGGIRRGKQQGRENYVNSGRRFLTILCREFSLFSFLSSHGDEKKGRK